MTAFSEAEIEYLTGERRLGRLATVEKDGLPHVVPVGMWHYNSELNTIDVSGRDFAATHKFHNVKATHKAAFIVDDLASTNPWRPRSVMVQGRAQAIDPPGEESEALIRIEPDKVVSWGLETN